MQSNTLVLAANWGKTINTAFGGNVARLLQSFYILKATKKQDFVDQRTRINGHHMTLTPSGMGKSTVTREFLTHCIRANVIGEGRRVPGRPNVFMWDGGTTWERARGSFSGGNVVWPILHIADFVYMPEIEAVITTQALSDMLRRLNNAMEDRKMSFGLVSAGGIDGETADEIEREAELKSEATGRWILFDPETKQISYQTGFTMIACTTTPLSPKLAEAFKTTGFQSRCEVSQWEPNQETLFKFYDKPYLPGSVEIAEQLKGLNDTIWRLDFEGIPLAPVHLQEKVHRAMSENYSNLVAATGVLPIGYMTIRDIGDEYRIMAASAIARAISKRDPEDKTQVKISDIQYDHRDANFAITCLSERFGAMESEMAKQSSSGVGVVPAWASDALVVYLRTAQPWCYDENPDYHPDLGVFQHKHFIDWLKGQGHSNSHANKIASKLKIGGVTEPIPQVHGSRRISTNFLISNGLAANNEEESEEDGNYGRPIENMEDFQ